MSTFYNKCLTFGIERVCFAGYLLLLFGIILLISNIFAFIKMTKYYGKMNFENTILLLSSIQSLLLIVQMISSENFFISIFLFIQIMDMCLINKKFKKISEGYINIKFVHVTTILLLIDIVYCFIFNIAYIFEAYLHSINLFYLNIFYYLLEIFTSFFLAYHCRKFLGYIKEDKPKEKKESNDKNPDINKKPIEKKKSDKLLVVNNKIGDELFYSIKKKQLSLLYLSNILCSFLEFIFEIILNFTKYSPYLINYIYHFIFFIHNSIIFICFYWMIRIQYSSNIDNKIIGDKEENKEKLIDDKYIKEEENCIEEENKRISGYLDEDKNKGKENEVNKKKIVRKISRNSTFDENDEFNAPNIIDIQDIQDIPSNESN